MKRHLVVLVLLAVFAGASAQADRPALYEKLSGAGRSALERSLTPPAAPEIAPFRAQLSLEDQLAAEPLAPIANVLVNNPAADSSSRDTQSETTLTLGAGATVIVGFNDSGSSLSGSHFTGYARSIDGGATFTDMGALPTDPAGIGDAGDPSLSRDVVSGKVYLSTLGYVEFDRIQMFRSTDDGVTFAAPVNATPGFTAAGDFQDKEWIAVDNFPGAGQGNVYLVWRNFAYTTPDSGVTHGVRFTRSTDGGATWTPNQGTLIAGEGSYNVQGANVVVGTDHAVYVFWLDQSAGASTPNIVKMRKSTDFGVTFGPAVTVATLAVTTSNGDLGVGPRSNSFPQGAVNPVSGDLYVVFADNPAGADRCDVFLVTSNDGGTTWSARTRLNDDATTTDQWQPAIAVRPDGAGLFVGWQDRRLDAANSLIDTFGVTGAIDVAGSGAITLDANFRITTESFPAVYGQDPVVNTTYMGDYDQAVADANFYYYTWGDNRLANSFHTHQPDVRLAKIPTSAVDACNPDITPPSISCPGNITTNTPNASAIVNYPAPGVSDNCAGAITVVSTPPSGSDFPRGTNTVTCVATDVAGNSNTCTFAVIVLGTSGALPVVTITAPDANASEPGMNTGRCSVRRTGSLAAPLTVNYTAAGTATPGADYRALSGVVTIPRGRPAANIVVRPRDDFISEPVETVIATISPSANYTVGSPGSATVNITSNE